MSDASGQWKVLVAADGSAAADQAARVAAQLARGTPAPELHLLHVLAFAGPDGEGRQLEEWELAETERARGVLDQASVPYGLHLAASNPAETIADYAHRHGFNEVVMGSRGRGRMERIVFGSVATTVVHEAEIPVTVKSRPVAAAATEAWLLPCDGCVNALRAAQCFVDDVRRGNQRVVHLLKVQQQVLDWT